MNSIEISLLIKAIRKEAGIYYFWGWAKEEGMGGVSGGGEKGEQVFEK